MGQPKAGTPAVIVQVPGKAIIELADRGNFFTQDDGSEHLDRTALEWQRLWGGKWERVSAAVPTEKRTLWEQVHKSEIPFIDGKWTSRLALGSENVGVRFRALVMAGYGPSFDQNDRNTYVEWGALAGDDSGRLVYSNEIVVQPWQAAPPPPPPAGPSGDLLAAEGFAKLNAALAAWDAKGKTPAQIRQTRAWLAVTVKDLPADSDVLLAVRALLEDEGE